MAITLAQINGTNVELDFTDSNDKLIIKHINDYQNTPSGDLTGNGINDVSAITVGNIDSYASKFLLGDIIRLKNNQATTNLDPTIPVYISNIRQSLVTRGGETQRSVAYTIEFYFPDNYTPDLDNVA